MPVKRGLLVVISGPSGAGKGTVVKKILEIDKSIKLSISATTRKKREDEVDGENYYFYKEKDFLELAGKGGFFEYAKYCNNFYGTPKKPIEEWLSKGFDVLLEIEVKGAKQIKEKSKDCVCIFLLPPSFEELYNRLESRGTESPESLKVRTERAKEELKESTFYDYLVVNKDVSSCASDVLTIIKSQKLKFSRMKDYFLEGGFF